MRWLTMLGSRCALGFLCIGLSISGHARAADFYLSPTGSNGNNGSVGSPWGTLQFAVDQLSPGDTLFLRGGTYNISQRVRFQGGDGGVEGSPVNLWAFPGEVPVLDFATMGASLGSSSGRGLQIDDDAGHLHFRGLTIQNAKDNGMHISGNNNVFEQLTLRYNADSGLQLAGTAANNLVLNTDSYENFDPHNQGENADGFAAKFANLGPGNQFYGNRAWGNSDDGWDLWEAGMASRFGIPGRLTTASISGVWVQALTVMATATNWDKQVELT